MFDVLVVRIFTVYSLMDSPFWFDTRNLEWLILYIEGSQVIISNEPCHGKMCLRGKFGHFEILWFSYRSLYEE